MSASRPVIEVRTAVREEHSPSQIPVNIQSQVPCQVPRQLLPPNQTNEPRPSAEQRAQQQNSFKTISITGQLQQISATYFNVISLAGSNFPPNLEDNIANRNIIGPQLQKTVSISEFLCQLCCTQKSNAVFMSSGHGGNSSLISPS